ATYRSEDRRVVLLGNADGSCQHQRDFAVGSGPRAVAVADVNGDGKPDLVVANEGDNTVSVLLGNGGTFQPQYTFPAASPGSVAVVDVDGDGRPDLLVVNSYDNCDSVLLGLGEGSVR